MCNLEIKIPSGEKGENLDTVEQLKNSLNQIIHFADEGLIVPDGDGYRNYFSEISPCLSTGIYPENRRPHFQKPFRRDQLL
jgi:hypothetical protein